MSNRGPNFPWKIKASQCQLCQADAPTFAAPSIQNVHHHRFFQKAVRSPQARQRIRDAGQRPGMRHDDDQNAAIAAFAALRSEEHTSELQSLMRTSYAVFCLTKKTN